MRGAIFQNSKIIRVENMESVKEYDPTALEEQFILRLPKEEAQKIREVLHNKPEKLKKMLKVNFDPSTNRLTLLVSNTKLYGTLKKLPTIIETYKTNICNHKSTLFKTADICCIGECSYEEKVKDRLETNHGICPPLKNVKTKRFRKTMFNEDFAVEAEKVTKELYYLLSTDLEAVSSKFEILCEGDVSNMPKESATSLFGQLSSDSEVETSFEATFNYKKRKIFSKNLRNHFPLCKSVCSPVKVPAKFYERIPVIIYWSFTND